MPDETSVVEIAQGNGRAAGWTDATVIEYVTAAARSIGVGSATDAGWAPPPTSSARPIQMTGGIPDADTLPTAALLAAMQRVLGAAGPEALRYGGFSGYEPLRAALAERSTRLDNVEQGPDNFVLTNGSAGAIDLIASTFINPGDLVVAEAPTFSGSLRTFRGHMARILTVPMDEQGMDTAALADLLERQARAGEPVKAIYIIPNYHNPTGTYLSLERRRQLVELSARYHAFILEDDAYGDIRFGGEDERLPSLYALAGGQGILRAVTFSKTIATGLRVGWVQGRADFVEACVRMRFDMGSSPLLHRTLAEFVCSGDWEAHIERMRHLYAEKEDALSRGLLGECEPYVRFQRPRGGFFLWVELLDGLDATRVTQLAAEEGVMINPGGHFFMDRDAIGRSHIRLAFSTEQPADLREGARRLARALARAAE